jgi:hypothetical protein
MTQKGGGNTSIITNLQAENQQLKQMLVQKEMVMHQRAEATFCAMIDCMNQLAAMAQAGHPGAKQLLKQWAGALDGARTAAEGLVVVRGNGTH